jgi:3-deoxy-manno-octulosonate cytidylyltransferase (CMP-KDO synthetase)
MHKLKAAGVIPARYASTRFSGKPLADICGKSMILRVVEQAEKCRNLTEVIVATDDKRIFEHLLQFGKKVVMTSPEARTGTDRCFEAAGKAGYDIIVNIQGDEPLLDPATVDKLVEALNENKEAVCSTPVKKITDLTEIDNPNVVKAVFDIRKKALYFSRSRIPFNRNECEFYYKHIGIYAFRTEYLKTFVGSESTSLELTESLEQLRVLETGNSIQCVTVESETIGVDTPSDLEKVKSLIEKKL